MKTKILELEAKSVFFTKTIKKQYPDFYQSVLDNFPGSKPVEKFWNYVNDNQTIPFCKFCKTKPVPFGKSFQHGYQSHCSQPCSQLDPTTRLKIKNTNLKNLGVEHNMQTLHCQDLRKQTWMNTLGVDNPAKNKSCSIKAINTKRLNGNSNGYLIAARNRGVENIMHIPEIAAKALNSMKKCKDYCLPSGRITHIQGYEHFALDILIKLYEENEIKIHTDVPTIKYILDGIQRFHYPDIFIPKENLIIEVKSGYTLVADRQKNIAKQKAAIAQGYDYEFWSFDKKGVLKFYTSFN